MKTTNFKRRHRSSRKRNKKLTKVNEFDRQDAPSPDNDVEIEYVVEPPKWEEVPGFTESAVAFSEFLIDSSAGTSKEANGETLSSDGANETSNIVNGSIENKNQSISGAKDQDVSDQDDDGNCIRKHLSSKKAQKLNRLTVSELKNLVSKPEVVDWYDVTAADPKLLVALKSYRNTVPVPAHWCQKRKYLQGKRGIEKPPFELPDFIKATGIAEIRSAVKEKEDTSRLKTKTRERHQPKMGKLDMDYQKLHDAFFRWQTKPRMTIHGDLYYEGKEFETKLKTNKPGKLSEELITALGITHLSPPPWLINMQRHGPPPSYPQLKIPGLNAPIPEGVSWGYHPGDWGKPPVDEYGRPLYGDIFGTMDQELHHEHMTPVDRSEWGKLIEYEEDNEYEQESPEDEPLAEDISGGIKSRSDIDSQSEVYADTSSGISSVPNGLETPESIELRKNAKITASESKQLYTVIQEKQVPSRGFLGPQHIYDVPAQSLPETKRTSTKRAQSPDVEMALNPDELQEGLNSSLVKNKYEQHLQVSKNAASEDLSDMVAEHANKQAKRRQKKDDKNDLADKKYDSKVFKF